MKDHAMNFSERRYIIVLYPGNLISIFMYFKNYFKVVLPDKIQDVC